jgi:putative ubiquitin-RnfH superfamily antitoxin RatB of RatAB toxin-antitoxin module
MSDTTLLEKWNQIREIMSDLELDVHKNARGVSSAGVRLRKGLRAVKAISVEIVRMTIAQDKARAERRAARRESEESEES